MAGRNRSRPFRWLWTWVLPILAVVCAAYYCSQTQFQLLLIQGNSMSPTYRNFQLTVLDRRQRDFARGDVVAFRCDTLSAVLVKRVVACPGDTAVIRKGMLWVNGAISPLYGESTVFEYAGLLSGPIRLNADEYIVIGDNIAQSKDSRYSEVGIVNTDQIMGKLLRGRLPMLPDGPDGGRGKSP